MNLLGIQKSDGTVALVVPFWFDIQEIETGR
jgi:hypothetical protein